MLLVKLVEALVRIFGKVGFDKSKHTADAGLFGALGMVGLCGLGRRRRRRRNPKRTGTTTLENASSTTRSTKELKAGDQQHRQRTSSGSYAFQPTTSMGSTSAFASMSKSSLHHHHGPPSVLRPEQADGPYREDRDVDDEEEGDLLDSAGGSAGSIGGSGSGSGGGSSGFIMGAWQPFESKSGNKGIYSPIRSTFASESSTAGGAQTQPQTQTPVQQIPKKTTGFARVGGGKANMDRPFQVMPHTSTVNSGLSGSSSQAAAAGASASSSSSGSSSRAFPSLGQHIQTSSPPSSYPGSGEGGMSMRPETPLDLVANPAVRQGSGKQMHQRTQSQSAIVEGMWGAPYAAAASTSPAVQGSAVVDSDSEDSDDDDGDDTETEEQPKKKWYHLGKARKRNSSTPAQAMGTVDEPVNRRRTASAGMTTQDDEFGALATSSEAPGSGRTFKVIRKGQQGQGQSPARPQP
jgi:MYXO-CTERM domain-containing protein